MTTPLQLANCPEDLSEAGFFPFSSYQQLQRATKYRQQRKCLAIDRLFGNSDTENSRVLQVSFQKCTTGSSCPTEDKFRAYMASKQPKIMLFYNQKVFKSDQFGSAAIMKQASVESLPF